jgi:hypothetical protein
MRRILPAIVLVLAAVPAGAQARTRSDSLPRELVIALLGGSLGGRSVEVHARLADDSLPADLFRDALILGFADYRVSRTTVAYFPYAPQGTIDTIRARLVAVGWTAPQERQDTTRGFVPAFGGSFPQVICRDGSVIVPTVMVRSINRSLAVISRQRTSGQYSPCNREQARPYDRMHPAANTPLPTLPAPAGMQGRMSGMGGSPDNENGLTMETSLIGSGTVADILHHYSSLFVTAGWKQLDQIPTRSIGVASFEIASKGVQWYSALVVSTPTDTMAHVHLTLRRK